MRDAALDLMRRGVVPIPIKYRKKLPIHAGWQRARLETVDVSEFDAQVNLGGILGEPSNWLVDVDLDCAEAIAIAPYILLSTRIFGRESARASHYLYRCVDATTIKFYDPVMVARKEKRKAMIVELRSTGCQTVLPPSVHELGELIEYDETAEENPVEVKFNTLVEELEELASASMFVRYCGLAPDAALSAARERRIPDSLPEEAIDTVRGWLHMAPRRAATTPRAATDIVARARAYVTKIPGAISGNRGHDQTYAVALALMCGFELQRSDALTLLEEYNLRCEPAWTTKELEHKIDDASKSTEVGRGYLREATREPTGAPQAAPAATAPPASVTRIDEARRPFRNNSYLTALTIIREDARQVLRGRAVELNEMTGQVEIARQPLRDEDVTALRAECERLFVGGLDDQRREIGLKLSLSDVDAAVRQVAAERSYHPVRQYLESLKWDGVERIAHVAGDILQADDTPLSRALLKRFFISAVARPMCPGCKVDTVLILVGPQGALKSSFFRVLTSPWFVDTVIDISSDATRAYQTLRRAWILEWAELETLFRARDASAVKAFLSSPVDSYIPKYGRNALEVKRSGIIVGTINPDEFLSDETGSRRFWPVRCGEIALSVAAEQRDQLWAEAMALYRAGEQWWLTREEEQMLQGAHEEHRVRDSWEERVIGWVEGQSNFTTGNVLAGALGKEIGTWTRNDEMRVNKILKTVGFVRKTDPHNKRIKSWRLE